ncbi:hypothetical protein [Microlunatus antarcticus]|uniref:Uncharacterized protein n=1 Tax=Microlunatus antarcticus TaxID=53388 RepID=A0A7W5JU98_9ACTN|nr:hypothetical protein [Microlunatus antarcticus]MBB3326457.1 hypothetical protein [Microlunatus antarcticus]
MAEVRASRAGAQGEAFLGLLVETRVHLDAQRGDLRGAGGLVGDSDEVDDDARAVPYGRPSRH